MDLVRDIGVEMAVAAIAFMLGLVASRIARTWAYLRARNFWRPLANKDLAIVLGEGFSDLSTFEASGLVGRGDLVASNELIAHLSAMGLPRLRPEFADRAHGIDTTGKGLRRNLIIVGGADANTLTKACLQRLRCGYQFEDDRADEDSGGLSKPPTLKPTEFAEGETRIFEPLVVDGQIVRDYGVIVRTMNPFLFEDHQDKRVVLVYGCYGIGTYAAALYAKEPAFLDSVNNKEEDIECIVACDAIDGTPQAIRHVFMKHYDPGALCKEDFLALHS